MLSFKELSEKKKTQCKINPKLDDLKEMHGDKVMCPECKGDGCDHCDGKGYHLKESAVPGKPAEKLKTDRNMFSISKDEREAAAERLKAKAAAKRKAKLKEEDAYVSQEEVSEESTEKIAETETSLLTFGQFTEGLSIDDQMRISREAAAKRKPYKDGDHQRARAKQLKNAAKNAKKDTRTDAQKMTDATGPRPGSRYRGD